MSPSAIAAARPPRMNPPAEPNRSSAPAAARRRRIPATGLPVSREDRRISGLVSTLFHLLLIALLITPLATHEGIVIEKPQGAGGPGPSGGGGGGKLGTGGVKERVAYVQVTPPPAPAVQAPVVPPPVIPPVAQPVIPPPQAITPPPTPTPEIKPETKPEVAKIDAVAPIPGTGGGTGRDGTTGSGPGTGGGVGTGIGTGRGSGIGPGTGGGVQANYPPSPTELFIPPLPMPSKVRGFHLIAEYDVDETGKVVNFTFTPTRDGGYNKRLEEVLKSFKFRAGTKPDGTPIRMKAQIIYDF
jgi:periplasmic protein TonB